MDKELFYIDGYYLDKYQIECVKCDSNLLVVAGAGCGKTSTILGKVKYLINNGIKNNEILCISLTNEATNGLRNKLENIGFRIDCLTFHKLGLNIINRFYKSSNIYDNRYLEYIIDIWYNGQNWRINKRFNQFANLYKTLKSIFRGVVNMPTSSDIFVNINGVGQISSFHENKILQLEKFIKDLAEIEVINKSKPFRKFLEFENFFDEEDIEIKAQIENSRYSQINNILINSINTSNKDKDNTMINDEEEDHINQV